MFENLSSAFGMIAVAIAGVFALYKWQAEQRRAIEERRFEQYWKLLQTATESTFLGQQKAAILLLKRYPEYRDETLVMLRDAAARSGPWSAQNREEIESTIKHLESLPIERPKAIS